ncbi:hypothetical protein FOCC_FOCC012794 [Frankliniella occidentalis]|nr:hypothetical protein FOCC_FOCC012794 [Frankliniella occidentalis]
MAAGLQSAIAGLNRSGALDHYQELSGGSSAPPPPPLPESAAPAPPLAPGPPSPTAQRKQHQPLSAISIQDLNSVQLRKTLASKTLSAPALRPPGPAPAMLQSGKGAADQNKQDLIAELKMSKDITGIKKLKVERARTEERHEKEIISEISKQLTATQFVEKVPETDATGNLIPPWKRQMLARKAAERARKEMEEKLQRDAEQKRLSAIPAWKRQLLAKKEEVTDKVGLYTPRVDEKRPEPGDAAYTKPQQQPEQQANGQTNGHHEDSSNKENSVPPGQPAQHNFEDRSDTASETGSKDGEDCPPQIIPWRAQLRKTNSTLSLLE